MRPANILSRPVSTLKLSFSPPSLRDAISIAERLMKPRAYYAVIVQTHNASLSSVSRFSSSSIVMK